MKITSLAIALYRLPLAAVLLCTATRLVGQTTYLGNFGTITIASPGTYEFGPDASGHVAQGTIYVTSNSGTVTLEGTGGVTRAIKTNGGSSNPDGVITCTGSCTTVITRLNIENQGQFGVIIRGNSSGNSISNSHVNNLVTASTQDGFGIAGGATGTIDSCTTNVDDDSYKAYGAGVSVTNSSANQISNGSCCQFGWGGNSNGNSHSFNNITCTTTNPMTYAPGSSDSGTQPGRSVIGFECNDGAVHNSNYATNITVSSASNNWNHIINVKFSAGSTCSTMKFTGSLYDTPSIKTINGYTYTPAYIAATGSGTAISGLTIDFGGVFAGSNGTNGNSLVKLNGNISVTKIN